MNQSSRTYFKFSSLKWFKNKKKNPNKLKIVMNHVQSLILTTLFAQQFQT